MCKFIIIYVIRFSRINNVTDQQNYHQTFIEYVFLCWCFRLEHKILFNPQCKWKARNPFHLLLHTLQLKSLDAAELMASFTLTSPFARVLTWWVLHGVTNNKIHANMSTRCNFTIYNILLIFTLVLYNNLIGVNWIIHNLWNALINALITLFTSFNNAYDDLALARC